MKIITRSKIIGLFLTAFFLFGGVQQQIKGMEARYNSVVKGPSKSMKKKIEVISPDGKKNAVVYCNDGILKIFDMVEGNNGQLLKTMKLSEDKIHLIQWSEDSSKIIICYQHVLRLWEDVFELASSK